jgi:hypothetical protein
LSKKEAKKAIFATFNKLGMNCPEKDHIKKVCKKFDNGDKRYNQFEYGNIILTLTGHHH